MQKVSNDEDEKTVVPSEKHYADFEPAVVPVAPDGGIPLGYAMDQPVAPPSVTPENFVCVRGPCRHYWHIVTMAGEGNPKSTWAELGLPEPRQHSHTCLANPGMETDLTDDCVYECSKWDPRMPEENALVQIRRDRYYKSVSPQPCWLRRLWTWITRQDQPIIETGME